MTRDLRRFYKQRQRRRILKRELWDDLRTGLTTKYTGGLIKGRWFTKVTHNVPISAEERKAMLRRAYRHEGSRRPGQRSACRCPLCDPEIQQEIFDKKRTAYELRNDYEAMADCLGWTNVQDCLP